MLIIPFNRSYWVLPGKLMAGEIPAAQTTEATIEKLNALAGCGIKTVINLMEATETDHDGNPFYDYSQHLQSLNMRMIGMPIVDLSIPNKVEMTDILHRIDENIKNELPVYVHCWGGIGRTGTVVGCYLIQNGYANRENVFDYINYLKRTTNAAHRASPETEEQMEFVRQWEYLSKPKSYSTKVLLKN